MFAEQDIYIIMQSKWVLKNARIVPIDTFEKNTIVSIISNEIYITFELPKCGILSATLVSESRSAMAGFYMLVFLVFEINNQIPWNQIGK